MMSESGINHSLESARIYINLLVDELIVYYHNAKEERQRLSAISNPDEEEFTLLEEIELLTGDIRGYASQVKISGKLRNEEEAASQLQKMRVFDVTTIEKWYFESGEDFWHLKLYLKMLDYLRCLLIEYIKLSQMQLLH
ncbi:hypothetical protein [[Phormidium] sp. ETS-05]|uniref:hypothetical protein n=1 Tax=[Phormidium] sp. ETS-05 TaxID=222819 RepID=UPI0018EED904|nr:hypothetical protein [[Phormidium] sp. ETS-05]